MIVHATTLLQYTSIGAFVVTLAAAWYGVRRQPSRWPVCVPPVVWASSGLAFYVLWFAGAMPPDAFVLMSAAHRTIGAVLILAMVIVLTGEVDDQ